MREPQEKEKKGCVIVQREVIPIRCSPTLKILGSGTTAVACKELGRRFIGIEINPEYCKIAENRLRQEVFPL